MNDGESIHVVLTRDEAFDVLAGLEDLAAQQEREGDDLGALRALVLADRIYALLSEGMPPSEVEV